MISYRFFRKHFISIILFIPLLTIGITSLAQKASNSYDDYKTHFNNATDLYVDESATGNNDGSSWSDAYNDLQDVLRLTLFLGSTNFIIHVAEGVYYPDEGTDTTIANNDTTAHFLITMDNLVLLGGYPSGGNGARNPAINKTILSGDISQNDINTDNNNIAESYTEIVGPNSSNIMIIDGKDGFIFDRLGENITSNTVIDGFIFTAGTNDIVNRAALTIDGGHPTADSCLSSPIIKNCQFWGNENDLENGGAVFIDGGWGGTANPKFINVIAVGNKTDFSGGAFGIYGSDDAGLQGIASPVFINAKIYNNEADDVGGAVFNGGVGGEHNPKFVNTIFAGNQNIHSVHAKGGAVYNDGQNNSTISNAQFINCVFSGNHSSADGGAIYNNGANNGNASSTIVNSIFFNNTATDTGNMIFNYESATASVSYSIVQNNKYSGNNNINTLPQFNDADGPDNTIGTLDDNYHIPISSPAMNAGNNSALPSDDFDLDNDGNTNENIPVDLGKILPRVIEDTVDIGAYENTQSLLKLVTLFVSDGVDNQKNNSNGSNTKPDTILWVGKSELATDGLDIELGEYQLPPQPDEGTFDTRFQLPTGEFSPVDVRKGSNEYSQDAQYLLIWQLSSESDGLSLSWEMPENLAMTIQDRIGGTVINETFTNSEGNYFIDNKDINSLSITFDGIVSVEDREKKPLDHSLSQNYPNPFNPTTKINFSIPATSTVAITIYNTLGQKVTELVNKDFSAGKHSVRLDFASKSNNLSSGVYFYRIEVDNKKGNFNKTKKMIYLK